MFRNFSRFAVFVQDRLIHIISRVNGTVSMSVYGPAVLWTHFLSKPQIAALNLPATRNIQESRHTADVLFCSFSPFLFISNVNNTTEQSRLRYFSFTVNQDSQTSVKNYTEREPLNATDSNRRERGKKYNKKSICATGEIYNFLYVHTQCSFSDSSVTLFTFNITIIFLHIYHKALVFGPVVLCSITLTSWRVGVWLLLFWRDFETIYEMIFSISVSGMPKKSSWRKEKVMQRQTQNFIRVFCGGTAGPFTYLFIISLFSRRC